LLFYLKDEIVFNFKDLVIVLIIHCLTDAVDKGGLLWGIWLYFSEHWL